MKIILAAIILMSLDGCSTKAVRCDGTLTPINAPAPAVADAPAAPTTEHQP